MSDLESLKVKAKLLQKAKKLAGKPIQLKEAFEIIAKASGFSNWRELKELYDATEHYCPHGSSSRWKVWYKSYEEAKANQGSGHFLLPYRDHFFVCDLDYIEFLGIESSNPDLKLVGNNWVEPGDSGAFKRITDQIRRSK